MEYCTKGIGVQTRNPIIQSPGYSQSCNGYSYCFNNPLKFADPFGFTAVATALDMVIELWNQTGEYGGYYGPSGPVSYSKTEEETLLWAFEYLADEIGIPYWRFGYRAYLSGFVSDSQGGTGFVLSLYNLPDLNWSFQINPKSNYYFILDPWDNYYSHQKATGQGGNGIDGDDIWVGATGTYLSTVGNVGHNAWWWQDAKGAYRSTKLLQVGSNGKYVQGVQGLRNSYAIAGKAASLTKIAGNTLGAVGVGISVYDMTQNGINVSNSMDAIMGATTFIPVVGWIISGTYFTASFITELSTGKSISEHAQGWVNTW